MTISHRDTQKVCVCVCVFGHARMCLRAFMCACMRVGVGACPSMSGKPLGQHGGQVKTDVCSLPSESGFPKWIHGLYHLE